MKNPDEIMFQAYSGMKIESHNWTKYSEYEVDQIVKWSNLQIGKSVLDMGCGIGRHANIFAKLGYPITAVDFVNFASVPKHPSVDFINSDIIDLDLPNKFYDLCICLYDVIGSFVDNDKNQALLNSAVRHLRSNAFMFVSVMSYEYTLRNAKYTFTYSLESDKIVDLPFTRNMECNGNAFDPETYIVDTSTHLVYRKEIFGERTIIPVVDRRYTVEEISKMCILSGLEIIWIKNVKVGKWETDFKEGNAKEILLMCRKR